MENIYINGRFLSQKITGVQRVGRELLKRLKNNANYNFIVLVPRGVNHDDFTNVSFVEIGKKNGYYWEQIELPKYLKKNNNPKLINFCNISPMRYKNSYVILHDTTYKDKSKYVKKNWALRYRIIVRSYIYKVKKIFTVSNFIASEIKRYYPKIKSNPIVLYNGYEHFDDVVKESKLTLPSKYFLSVGSVNMNKNFKYILNLALNNPNETFVIVGKKNEIYDDFIKGNELKNCIFTNYISDGELKNLYANCYGFILPSFYEGFGLPPLEALSLGCKRLYLSKIPVFEEIYGKVAKFFDPYNLEKTVDLSDYEIDENNINELLKKYRWDNSVEELIKNI